MIVAENYALRRRPKNAPATPIKATAPGVGSGGGMKSNVKGTADVVWVGEPDVVRFCC